MILQTLFGFGKEPIIKPAAQSSTRVARDTSPRETNLAGRILGKLTFNPITKFLFTPVQKQINERAIARGTLPTRPVLERQNRVEGFRRVFRHVESPILDLGGRVVNVIRENATPLDVLAGLIGGGAVVAKKAPQTVGSVLPRKFRPKVSTSGPVSSLDELERSLGFTAEERVKFAKVRKDVDELFGASKDPKKRQSLIEEIMRTVNGEDDLAKFADRHPELTVGEIQDLMDEISKGFKDKLSTLDEKFFGSNIDELENSFIQNNPRFKQQEARFIDNFDAEDLPDPPGIFNVFGQDAEATIKADAGAFFARGGAPIEINPLPAKGIVPEDPALLDELIAKLQGRPADLEIIFRELGKRRN